MMYKASILFVLFSFSIFSVGCQNRGANPSNPFASNLQTVPPPSTFSSQGAYLGQMPGAYIPQTPATTFPSSVPAPSTQPATTSANSGEKATLFTPAAEKDADWTPVAMVPTSQTAFQAMDAKVNSAADTGSGGTSESLVVGTAYAVTTITDESQPEPLTEPPLLLYSGH